MDPQAALTRRNLVERIDMPAVQARLRNLAEQARANYAEIVSPEIRGTFEFSVGAVPQARAIM